MAERVSVTELNRRVKELLTSTPYLSNIWVVGEISNLTIQSSGHAYFSIKDAGGTVSAAMFASALKRIDFTPASSMKIEAFGHVDLYPPTGRYQFIVETMRRSGIGELYQEYERLKKKLEGEGLFDDSRKRPIPTYPKVIGVVTSPTGAVIHDIITTTARLNPVDILLAPAKVQGDGAADSIVGGIELLNKAGVDVIIVGRGGGSIEDLWAFNEEKVVRAIAASKVPIISSVGHETDFTLADFVADKRAPTPTGAAEMAVRKRVEIRREIEEMFRRAGAALMKTYGTMVHDFGILDAKLDPSKARDKVDMHEMELERLSDAADTSMKMRVMSASRTLSDLYPRPESALRDMIINAKQRAQNLFVRIEPDMSDILHRGRMRIEGIGNRPDTAIDKRLQSRASAVAERSARIDALSPYAVLSRGYSFITDTAGNTITSIEGVGVGSEVTIRMRDGKASAKITGKEKI